MPKNSNFQHISVSNVVLLVGDNVAHLLTVTDPHDSAFSKLSMLASTIYSAQALIGVPPNSFFPKPRTHSSVIRLTPRDDSELSNNPRLRIQQKLFNTEHRSSTVRKVIKESLSEKGGVSKKWLTKRARTRADRRAEKEGLSTLLKNIQATGNHEIIPTKQMETYSINELIDQLGIPEYILSRPFNQLNNSEIQILARALYDKYG